MPFQRYIALTVPQSRLPLRSTMLQQLLLLTMFRTNEDYHRIRGPNCPQSALKVFHLMMRQQRCIEYSSFFYFYYFCLISNSTLKLGKRVQKKEILSSSLCLVDKTKIVKSKRRPYTTYLPMNCTLGRGKKFFLVHCASCRAM